MNKYEVRCRDADELASMPPSPYLCEEVYDKYTDTAGNLHWTGTHSGEHTIRTGGENMDGVVKITSWGETSRWTRKCLICETVEDPTASIIREDAAWICPKCRNGLLKIIRTEDDE